MEGLGNDFVVLDARTAALDLTPERRRVIADRRLGVGCDQLIVLEPPTEREADVFMRIYNPDGGEAQACAAMHVGDGVAELGIAAPRTKSDDEGGFSDVGTVMAISSLTERLLGAAALPAAALVDVAGRVVGSFGIDPAHITPAV